MTQSVKPIWNLYVKSYYLAIIITVISFTSGLLTDNQMLIDVYHLSSTYLAAPLTLFLSIPFGFIELAIICYGIIGIMALGEIILRK
jgi:hypothetical protein